MNPYFEDSREIRKRLADATKRRQYRRARILREMLNDTIDKAYMETHGRETWWMGGDNRPILKSLGITN